jgi:hypothetical protein
MVINLFNYQFVEFIESPKPGVSTIVSRSLTPLTSISTVDASMLTVFFGLSLNYLQHF